LETQAVTKELDSDSALKDLPASFVSPGGAIVTVAPAGLRRSGTEFQGFHPLLSASWKGGKCQEIHGEAVGAARCRVTFDSTADDENPWIPDQNSLTTTG
jgi:hypothetical protein